MIRDLIRAARQRLRDYRLERRIEALQARCARQCAARDHIAARNSFTAMRLLVSQRSPEQVERLERARGLRA